MTLPVSIAQKLQQMLVDKTAMPSSALKHATVNKMLQDGVLQQRLIGKNKSNIFISNPAALQSYLANHFGVSDIDSYIAAYHDEAITRSDAVVVSGNSKLKSIRSFKGFLVNSYQPVNATLNSSEIFINPMAGSYTFISDWETFLPDESVTIIGVENPENFRQIEQQRYLFNDLQPLFISRYPQGNDVVKWLQQITNPYLHFGDLDFAGINIYLNEYKRWLGNKASFFVPANTAEMLHRYGNRELYNRQLHLAPDASLLPENLQQLISLLHLEKKVLEQEVFIGENFHSNKG